MTQSQEDEADADGIIHVALDESFDPMVCVGATVAESDFATINDSIQRLYEELTGYSWLDELDSFQRFKSDGFHMSNDSADVAGRFVPFLGHTLGFNSYLFFSEAVR
ncbi:hypothetical protein [Microlunatus parietis]|uniref:DUF3800 domain-containing protein n=1 Tax=Microlunatus parietis TaxID=682979 RepID=A0A7Y9LCN7_9ACTN|nr:hypothetical protein [Microlunatus parietis]NYE71880.1 hypothetical protein [Microlunatus parietis]